MQLLALLFLAAYVHSTPPNKFLKASESLGEHLLNRPTQPTELDFGSVVHQKKSPVTHDLIRFSNPKSHFRVPIPEAGGVPGADGDVRWTLEQGPLEATSNLNPTTNDMRNSIQDLIYKLFYPENNAIGKSRGSTVAFLPFKDIVTSHRWKISSDGKIIMPSGYKILDEYIVPDAWKSSLPPGFYQSEHGDILPIGYVVKNAVVVPQDYVVTNKAILPQGWKDGGSNAFAVPEDWLVNFKNGRARPPLSTGLFNGGFPRSWKEESSMRKWIAPQFYYDEKIRKAVPKEIRYIQSRFSRLSFPEDMFKEIETTHGKVLIPTVLKYEHGKIVPPAFRVTPHGRVILSTWFEDAETGVVAPPGLDLEYFGKDIRLKLSYLGKLDRLAPDGKGILKVGYIKSKDGDVIPETWRVMPDRLYLPPSFKTSGLNILFEHDKMDGYGDVFAPGYDAWLNFAFYSVSHRSQAILDSLQSHHYMLLPWRFGQQSIPLYAPDTYAVVKEKKLVYPKDDFVVNKMSGKIQHKDLHWINTGTNTVLVPKEEYSFIPTDEQLRAIV